MIGEQLSGRVYGLEPTEVVGRLREPAGSFDDVIVVRSLRGLLRARRGADPQRFAQRRPLVLDVDRAGARRFQLRRKERAERDALATSERSALRESRVEPGRPVRLRSRAKYGSLTEIERPGEGLLQLPAVELSEFLAQHRAAGRKFRKGR